MQHLLLSLCICTLLLFSDRGAISCSSISGSEGGIPQTFNLTLSESSWMYAASMVGLTFGSLISGQLSKVTNSLRLVGGGLALFSLGSLGMSLSPNFITLLICRALIGASSGPFISVASPLINDHSAINKRSVNLACLFLSMPAGFSLGFLSGSITSEAWSWRGTFALQATLMLPLVALMLGVPNPPDIDRGEDESSSTAVAGKFNIGSDLRRLCGKPLVLLIIFGVSQYNGSLSSFGFYGAKATGALFHLEAERADLLFGLLGLVTGVLGTLLGGVLLDALGANASKALAFSTFASATAAITITLAFVVVRKFVAFAVLAAIAELAIFSTSAPLMASMLWSTPADLRPFALGISEVFTHMIGDVPLPPLLGVLYTRSDGDWRLTMGAAAGVMGIAALIFSTAWCLASKNQQDSSIVDSEILDVAAEAFAAEDGDIERPLLSSES